MLRACVRAFLLIGLLMPLASPGRAAVNDVYPGDYFPLALGATTVALYAYDREQAGPYADGRQRLDGSLDSTVVALRVSRSWRWADTLFAGVAVLPWTNASIDPPLLATALGKQARGLSDLRLGMTGWLINDKAEASYLGVTAMLILPTGDYDTRQTLNAGENRWRFVLGGGWQKDLTPQLLFELSPEIVIHGDNDEYVGRRLAQRNAYALIGYLRYRLNGAWHIHVGAQINRGGETSINGVEQRNQTDNDRVMVGMTWFLPGQQQIILRAARDTSIENGFRMDREIALRYQVSF